MSKLPSTLLRLTASGRPEAPVLVLGNSLATDLRVWDSVAGELAVRFRLVRFDYPGHGDQAAEPVVAIDDLADRLAHALESAGITRFHYAGLSMGGALGLVLALRHRQRIDGLVLSNTAAQFGAAQFWSDRIQRARCEGMAALAEPTVARWLTPQHAKRAPGLVAQLQAMVSATSVQGYSACCEAVRDFDLRSDLPQVSVPTLVLASSQDVATPLELARELQAGVPRARITELPGAHLGHLGAPLEWVSAVHQFLSTETTDA